MDDRETKADPAISEGVWLGRDPDSGEHILASSTGTVTSTEETNVPKRKCQKQNPRYQRDMACQVENGAQDTQRKDVMESTAEAIAITANISATHRRHTDAHRSHPSTNPPHPQQTTSPTHPPPGGATELPTLWLSRVVSADGTTYRSCHVFESLCLGRRPLNESGPNSNYKVVSRCRFLLLRFQGKHESKEEGGSDTHDDEEREAVSLLGNPEGFVCLHGEHAHEKNLQQESDVHTNHVHRPWSN